MDILVRSSQDIDKNGKMPWLDIIKTVMFPWTNLLRSPRWHEKFPTNCLISRKKQYQKNIKLNVIENNIEFTQNNKVTGWLLQQLQKHKNHWFIFENH